MSAFLYSLFSQIFCCAPFLLSRTNLISSVVFFHYFMYSTFSVWITAQVLSAQIFPSHSINSKSHFKSRFTELYEFHIKSPVMVKKWVPCCPGYQSNTSLWRCTRGIMWVFYIQANNPDCFSVNHHLKAKSTALIYVSGVHFRPFSRTAVKTVN